MSDIKAAVDLKVFLSDAVKTTAVVTDVNVYYDKNPNHHDVYTTTFQFESDGKTYNGETKSMDFKPDWKKNDTIEIYYNTENPYDTYVYNKHDIRYKLFGLILSLAFLAVGIFLLVYAIKGTQLNTDKTLNKY